VRDMVRLSNLSSVTATANWMYCRRTRTCATSWLLLGNGQSGSNLASKGDLCRVNFPSNTLKRRSLGDELVTSYIANARNTPVLVTGCGSAHDWVRVKALNLKKEMVGTRRLELLTSTVSRRPRTVTD
jgi:hypothetical protein